jgi:hypothetical protein
VRDADLDSVYGRLCREITAAGDDAPLYLARFALLAINALDDAGRAAELVEQARLGTARAAGADVPGG